MCTRENKLKKLISFKFLILTTVSCLFITLFASCNHLIGNPQTRGNAISSTSNGAYQIAARFESLPRTNSSLNKINNIKYLNLYPNSFLLLIDSKGRLLIRRFKAGKLSETRLLFDSEIDLSKGVFAISNNWRFFAYHYRGKTSIFDLSTRKLIYTSRSVRAPVTFMSFESNNSALLVASADTHVYRFKFLEAKSCKGVVCERTKQRYAGHATVVTVVKHLKNAPVFVSSDWEGRVIVWKFFDAEIAFNNANANLFSNRFFSKATNNVQFRKRDNDVVEKIEINSTASLIAVLLRSGFLEVWKIRGMEKVARFKALKGIPKKVAFSNDNSFLTVIDNQQMSLYSLQEILIEDENELTKADKKIVPLQTLDGNDFSDFVFVGSRKLILLENSKSLKLVDLSGLVQNE